MRQLFLGVVVRSPQFWVFVMVVPLVNVLPFYTFALIQRVVQPSDLDILQARRERATGRDGLDRGWTAWNYYRVVAFEGVGCEGALRCGGGSQQESKRFRLRFIGPNAPNTGQVHPWFTGRMQFS